MKITNIFRFLTILFSILVLSACGKEETIVIHFNTVGGEAVSSIEVSIDETRLQLPSTTKTGHIFKGWSIQPDSTLIWDKDLSDQNESLTLYAVWSLEVYSITIHPNNSESNYTIDFNVDDTIVITNPVRDGFQFDGWYYDEMLTRQYNSTTKMMESFHLYAKWTENTTVYTEENTIYFNIASQSDSSITFHVVIDGAVSFVGYDMTITYDTTVLQLDSYTNGLNNIVNDATSGTIIFNYVDVINQQTSTVTILILQFTLLSNFDNNISLTVEDIIDITDGYEIIHPNYAYIGVE